MTTVLIALVVLVGAVAVLNLLLTVGVIRRPRKGLAGVRGAGWRGHRGG